MSQLSLNPRIVYEMDNLPQDFQKMPRVFALLVAALRAHDLYAAVASPEPSNQFKELELKKSPFVTLYTPSHFEQLDRLYGKTPNTPEFFKLSNKLFYKNLLIQQKLLAFLEEFYSTHTAPFYARLVMESQDMGAMYLVSQGSSTLAILKDKAVKKKRLKECQDEFGAFMAFLCMKAHEFDLRPPKGVPHGKRSHESRSS